MNLRALLAVRLAGLRRHYWGGSVRSSLLLAGEFETVHEVRSSVEWARPMHRISQTSAAIDGIALDLTWRILDREIIVLGGPRFGWYRMKRDDRGPDARSSPAVGGALAVVLPRWDSLEVEMRLALTGYPLEQSGTPASRRDPLAWIQATHIGLRYRIR